MNFKLGSKEVIFEGEKAYQYIDENGDAFRTIIYGIAKIPNSDYFHCVNSSHKWRKMSSS